jgi:hypothetical protein
MWSPEADCTTFTVVDPEAREHNCLSNLDTVDLHHPNMAKLNLVGVESSSTLCTGLKEFGLIPANATWPHTIAFRRPVTTLKNIPILKLDASEGQIQMIFMSPSLQFLDLRCGMEKTSTHSMTASLQAA